MQNFLGSLRSPALCNNLFKAYLTLRLEHNICTYIRLSFNKTNTIATGEGKFDMKMQGF